VVFLLDHGAEINAKETYNGLTPLHVATGVGNKEVVDLLLARGADIEARDYAKATPLHWAAAHDLIAIADLLLVHNADVNAKDSSGWTPADAAAGKGNREMVQLLRLYGSNEPKLSPMRRGV
jgi:cytohesin